VGGASNFHPVFEKHFKSQITAGDVLLLQFESGGHDKYFMFSLAGT
jgi:hypothetical protein